MTWYKFFGATLSSTLRDRLNSKRLGQAPPYDQTVDGGIHSATRIPAVGCVVGRSVCLLSTQHQVCAVRLSGSRPVGKFHRVKTPGTFASVRDDGAPSGEPMITLGMIVKPYCCAFKERISDWMATDRWACWERAFWLL
eukprot:GHVT01105156.1.p1 GENE.GHVT01105156.1~~GHVT01105156.1.p1  ORF type:complete len:139 (-),score=2.56 GHVT01105156.1:145-561(-)